MSSKMYNQMWHQTQEALNSLLDKESQKIIEPQRNPVFIFQTLATFYIKYVQIFRNLENVYDQIVHPQKRILIRKILDGVMGRILELKSEMVELELSEFHYFDDILQDLKLAPVWRGFHQCRKTERQREEEMIFLGMNPPPMFNEVSATITQAEKVTCLRNEVQMKHEEDYREALVTIKDDLKLIEGPYIKENLQDQIRHWFIECRNLTGTFPDYPDVEEGGSAIVFSNKTPQQVIDDIMANQEEEEKNKKKKKEKKAKKEKRKKQTKEKNKEEDKGWKMSPSVFLHTMEEGNNVYKDIWKNKDESGNFPQDYDREMIKEEKRKELESEIRVQVDELMRQELKNLKLAVNREKELPAKTRKKKGGKNEKKGKKGKKEKRGKDKDLTADRSIESLYKELVEEGLLIQSLKVNLSDYIGEYSYLGTTLRQVAIEPMPSLLDVRQLIALYGILPLGSAAVHEKAPLVRSLLLAGPSGVGKKMLVHAICTETGANLFDLSAANIAGKYPGKSGLQMMLHVVLKVARQLQPSVVWIGDTEKTFYRKVPSAERMMEPKRLKKQLPKILKLLKPNDRILIVGTTHRPFDAELGSFCRVYQKIILVPRPDYASRYVLWKHIIQRSGGVITNALNVSCLAKVTDGFTQGHIVEVVKGVLTDRRIRQQTQKPLVALEFVAALSSMNPVYQEEEESFKNWYAKTPMGKKRNLALTEGNAEKQRDKGKKKEKKGEKEKKKK
ncbi:dynein regulatory complex protein 11 isoform X2 [Rhinolophus sinicus]|uniref:dynein regulatory complex protein 11 isoform X2 n=1 Tax=Rhinolophus sinicus TaxID=89399 RepID=UPI003D78C768